MNNNLSASPTLEDIEEAENSDNTTTTDETTTQTETEPTDTTTITWHCPYCDYTHSDLGQLRNHITESVENEHKGTSGLSPTQDIIGTNEDGDEIRRIEGSGKRPDEDHHLDHGEKKKLIINAWLENNQERDIQAFASIIPVSEQYVQRITKQLETGEITPEDFRKEMEWDIRDELGERLEDYYEQQETPTMSLATTDNDELEHGSKKQQIINAWLLDDSLNYSELDEILPANKEYIGRVFRSLNNEDIDRTEIEEAADREFQTELQNALEDEGVEVQGNPTTTIELDEETDTEPTEQPAYQDTLDSATKKSRILNSVLLARDLNVDLTNGEIASAANCSTQYAQKITKQIKDGDITDEELQEATDEPLQDALQQYYEDNNIIAPDSSDGTVNIDLSNDDDPFENVPVSKREALVNVFLYDPEISKANAGDLAGASAEYARQTYNGIQDGEYDPDEYLHEGIQTTLTELDESGALDAFFSDEDTQEAVEESTEGETVETEQETIEDVEPETPETTEATATTDTTDTTSTSRTTRTQGNDGTVPASEIKNLRDTADMLYRQAQYEGDDDADNKKAEFIAKELRDRIDTLLEQTQ